MNRVMVGFSTSTSDQLPMLRNAHSPHYFQLQDIEDDDRLAALPVSD
jgi:hypothetical protein